MTEEQERERLIGKASYSHGRFGRVVLSDEDAKRAKELGLIDERGVFTYGSNGIEVLRGVPNGK